MKRGSGLAILAVVVLAGVYLLNWLGVLAFTSDDGTDVAARLSAELSARFGSQVHVTCPAKIPEKKGGIEDCEANAGHGTTTIRIVQDDSRGHSHWTVNDVTVLANVPATSPTPVVTHSFSTVTLACVGAGAAPAQCGCVEQQIRDQGSDGDLARAADAYNTRQPLPDDLARMVESCRRGA